MKTQSYEYHFVKKKKKINKEDLFLFSEKKLSDSLVSRQVSGRVSSILLN